MAAGRTEPSSAPCASSSPAPARPRSPRSTSSPACWPATADGYDHVDLRHRADRPHAAAAQPAQGLDRLPRGNDRGASCLGPHSGPEDAGGALPRRPCDALARSPRAPPIVLVTRAEPRRCARRRARSGELRALGLAQPAPRRQRRVPRQRAGRRGGACARGGGEAALAAMPARLRGAAARRGAAAGLRHGRPARAARAARSGARAATDTRRGNGPAGRALPGLRRPGRRAGAGGPRPGHGDGQGRRREDHDRRRDRGRRWSRAARRCTSPRPIPRRTSPRTLDGERRRACRSTASIRPPRPQRYVDEDHGAARPRPRRGRARAAARGPALAVHRGGRGVPRLLAHRRRGAQRASSCSTPRRPATRCC